MPCWPWRSSSSSMSASGRSSRPYQGIDQAIRPKSATWSLQHIELDVRGMLRRPVKSLSSLLKVCGRSAVDIHKLLRISIDHWKPAALHLDHDPVSLEECVIAVSEIEL